MRWPFGPPHLTLKPSKKRTKKNKETKKTKNTKQPKKNFSVINQNCLFLGGGGPKIVFLTTWPRKRAPPKHSQNRGFSLFFFEKKLCVTKRPFLDQKNPNPEIPVMVRDSFSLVASSLTLHSLSLPQTCGSSF